MTKQQQIEQELSLKPFAFQQKVEACKALYIACQGRHHDHIQQEMRNLGNDRWNNRCLYARFSNGKYIPGWPERFGWKSEPPAVARGLTRHARSLEKSRNRAKQRRLIKLAAKAGNAAALGCNAGSSGVSQANTRDRVNGHADAPEGGRVPIKTADPNSTNSKNPTNSTNFLSWLKKLRGNYNWDWKFQRYVIEKLEAFERGDTTRLMLFVPPRHGKSELVTVRYAAWHLQNNPKSNIIIGSYNQNLANRFSRRMKNVYAEAIAIAEVGKGEPPALAGGPTPDTTNAPPTHDRTKCDVCLTKAQECPHANSNNSPNSPNPTNPTDSTNLAAPPRRANTDAEWETTMGGGVRAVGCGAGITGFGANLIIIDDPVKSRSEAESQTIRDKVWDWFNDDIYTRLEPNGKVILIQTRWHEDDLAGRLLREMREDEDAEQWEVIEFPAIAEAPKAPAGGLLTEPPASAGGTTPASLHLSPSGNAPQRTFPDTLWNTTPIPPAHAGGSDKKPIYYIRNGQHIPVYTLGDPNKNRNSDTTPALPMLSTNSTDSKNSMNPMNSTNSTNCLPTDALGRLPGEALCPERYNLERLLKTKKRLGTYSFNALYQQRPIPAEGGFFKRHWFKIVDHIPAGLKWKRGYDLGISASPGADYTATARVAFDADGNLYIDRVLRRRMEYPEQRRAILGLIATERDTEHFIEKSANGNAVIQDLRRERGISDRHFRGVEVRESKTARAFTWNALAEEGRVHLIRSAWNQDFIDEACSFPGGVNDDQIDAVSIAVKMLREEKKRQAHGF